MRSPAKAALAILIWTSLLSASALAGPFEDGSAAYRRGEFARAMQLWQPLATSNADVQNDIGTLYMDGKGVPQNTIEALRWIARSAANGSSSGQNNLGGLYRDGKGVPRDFGKAFAFFAASAAQGNGGGQFNLGLVYEMGQGTPVDNLRAYMWFDLASSQVAKAVGYRDEVRAHLTTAEIKTARAMEQRCRQSNFKACG